MTRLIAIVALIILMPFSALAQEDPVPSAELWSTGYEAYLAGDGAGFLSAMEELERRRPYQRASLYNVSIGMIMTGDLDGAMAKLSHVADLGLYIGLGDDEDFSPLVTHPGYAALLARMEANYAPLGTSELVRQLDITGALSEGVALDAASGSLFVSSVRAGRIFRITPDGEITRFAGSESHPGLGGLLGMAVDSARNLLWVTSSTPGLYIGANKDAGNGSALYAFDLTNGAVRYHYPLEGDNHFLGEVMLSPDGAVYTSDSGTPIIYRVSDDLSSLDPYFAAPQLLNLQGFDFDNEGRIYVADYIRGIFTVDPLQGGIMRLETPEDVNPTGVDGLYFHEGALIGIQNATRPMRIVRFDLSEDGAAITGLDVLDSNNALWNEPTLGQVVNGKLIYMATTGWADYTETGEIRDGVVLDPIRIMSVDLH